MLIYGSVHPGLLIVKSANMRVYFHFRDVRQILFAVGLGRERCVAGAYFNVQWSVFVGQ